jgi:acetolactate synthase-1/2/3 large subunit
VDDGAPVKMRGYRATRPQEVRDVEGGGADSGRSQALILAGQGVIQSNAMKEGGPCLRRAGSMPVTVTLLGISGFREPPLNIGMMGMHGEAWVNHAIQEADLLLRVRHALRRPRDRQSQDIRPERKKIHVDIDPSEINKNVRADAAIVADLRETLMEMLDLLEPATHGPWLKYRVDEG